MKTYIVDSFTDQPYQGNPAAVCLTETPLTEARMQDIAREFNLSETAFVVPRADPGVFSIRYFSPQMEIPLCGHATLAAAKILFQARSFAQLHFVTVRDVRLEVSQTEGWIAMAFPAYGLLEADVPPAMLDGLGLNDVVSAFYNRENNILLLEISRADELCGLCPDFERLRKSHNSINGVLVTSPGANGYDFYSRYFWPWSGTTEDPVTGATHTFLAPFWSKKLGKTKLKSFQCSKRSGFMEVDVLETGIVIRSQAVIILEGLLRV